MPAGRSRGLPRTSRSSTRRPPWRPTSSTSVHVVSNTTAASCGEYDNTAAVTTTNDGSDEDSATTEVRCADIDVEKDADAASVNAGRRVGFAVAVADDGDGDAVQVVQPSPMPCPAAPGSAGPSSQLTPMPAGRSRGLPRTSRSSTRRPPFQFRLEHQHPRRERRNSGQLWRVRQHRGGNHDQRRVR